ncbi:MAG: hypothetical protein QOI02_736, partial [Actinomycetota bacterium]|nr:hypothetical protein [Actinomycetota bacterium]
TSGSASGAIALAVGANTITTVVTAQDASKTTYTTTVTRAASAVATLSALSLSDGTLAPAFAAGTLTYSASVPYPVSSVTVTPTTTDAAATVTVDGTTVSSASASAPVDLAAGASTAITVTVTAQDGSSKDYTITVSRDPGPVAPTWTDNTLAKFQFQVPYSDQVQATGDAPITYSVSAGDLPIGVSLNTATGAITGTPKVPTTYAFTITATNPAGSIPQSFSGTVSGKASITLSLGFGAGDVAAGAPFTVTAEGLIPDSVVSAVLHSTPVTLFTTTADGSGSFSQAASIPAGTPAGAHELIVTAVAPDGTTLTATAWFSVLANGTIGQVSRTGPIVVTSVDSVQQLASTGADITALVSLALILLLLAAALTVVSRRRRA